MDYHAFITIDPLVRSGKPCVRGTRITVGDVLDYLGGGMTIPEVLEDFPDLEAEDIQACLSFAADRERHVLVPTVVPNCDFMPGRQAAELFKGHSADVEAANATAGELRKLDLE